jgi:hypothetical protein
MDICSPVGLGGEVLMAVTLAAAWELRFSIPDRSRHLPTIKTLACSERLDMIGTAAPTTPRSTATIRVDRRHAARRHRRRARHPSSSAAGSACFSYSPLYAGVELKRLCPAAGGR